MVSAEQSSNTSTRSLLFAPLHMNNQNQHWLDVGLLPLSTRALGLKRLLLIRPWWPWTTTKKEISFFFHICFIHDSVLRAFSDPVAWHGGIYNKLVIKADWHNALLKISIPHALHTRVMGFNHSLKPYCMVAVEKSAVGYCVNTGKNQTQWLNSLSLWCKCVLHHWHC